MNFLGLSRDKSDKEVLIYARVSSSRQKDDLKRQIASLENYARERNWRITGVYKDIASGLNDGRKDLFRMISDLPTNVIFHFP